MEVQIPLLKREQSLTQRKTDEFKLESTYNASQKHESTFLHTYVLNEFLTADRSCTTNYF